MLNGRGGNGAPVLDCVRGIPIDGQQLGGKPLEHGKTLTVFPGDLPDDPIDAFDPKIMVPGSLSFIRFRPRLAASANGNGPLEWPHVGLDRVVAFLIGDKLT